MHIEDRLYLQVVIGTGIGIVLGILAFTLVTTCSIGSLCKSVDAAETLPVVNRETRTVSADYRLVPQYADNDLEAIVVEWAPQVQLAIDNQTSNANAIDNGVLPTGHTLGDIPDTMAMQLDGQTLDNLITLNAESLDLRQHNWNARDWMIITGGYNLLAAAELDAELFREAGYDIQIFFRNDEFRTAIVGYDSAEAATIDLISVRNELRTSALLGQYDVWCGAAVEQQQFVKCTPQHP